MGCRIVRVGKAVENSWGWYHLECLGLTRKDVDLIDKFICPQCSKTLSAMKRNRQPRKRKKNQKQDKARKLEKCQRTRAFKEYKQNVLQEFGLHIETLKAKMPLLKTELEMKLTKAKAAISKQWKSKIIQEHSEEKWELCMNIMSQEQSELIYANTKANIVTMNKEKNQLRQKLQEKEKLVQQLHSQTIKLTADIRSREQKLKSIQGEAQRKKDVLERIPMNENSTVCPMCCVKPRDSVLGCGHQACEGCSINLETKRGACPVCGEIVNRCIKMYQS
mmetsp:Transcript_9395/g.13095  ORF Transcript_9395/g.13095 Transcript_9395/m.13095 type:complete len:277 (+) Transcript_9395:202-1032(+)